MAGYTFSLVGGDNPPAYTEVDAKDYNLQSKSLLVTGEYPLTIYINKKEIVTLMTLAQDVHMLVLGYLLNQQIIEKIEQIKSIQVDWSINVAVIDAHLDPDELLRLGHKVTVTSGCGQGTMFGKLDEQLDVIAPKWQQQISPHSIERMLGLVRGYDSVYKVSGAVHSCVLFAFNEKSEKLVVWAEDVGRHNAIDVLRGYLAYHATEQAGECREHRYEYALYTTGRLTSEMVIKCVQMKICYLLSRSGTTRMGLDLAKRCDLVMLARVGHKRFLAMSGDQRLSV